MSVAKGAFKRTIDKISIFLSGGKDARGGGGWMRDICLSDKFKLRNYFSLA